MYGLRALPLEVYLKVKPQVRSTEQLWILALVQALLCAPAAPMSEFLSELLSELQA
jgi:hypothetical protein